MRIYNARRGIMGITIGSVKDCSTTEWIDFTDDGVYKHKYKNDNIIYKICNNEKFEILFEKGIKRLQEGDYHLAIIYFSTALERFYEFAIKVMLYESEIDEDEFTETFKGMNGFSEREIGAFYILYLKEFLQACPKVTRSNIEFRNKVVHKGYVPTYNEVLKYGEYVLSYLRNIKRKLEFKYSKELIYKVISKRVFDLKNKISKEEKIEIKSIDTFSIPTIIGLLIDFEKQDEVILEQYLKSR